MTNLQEINVGIALEYPDGSEKKRAILDLVAENQMSSQLKAQLPIMQEAIEQMRAFVDMFDDWADGFDVIDERYEEADND